MRRLFRLTLVIALTMGLAMWASAPIRAQSGQKAASVGGKWMVTVDGPHGNTPMGLVLEQKGKKITGTFSSPHGDVPVEGEFADGTLTLTTTSSGSEAGHVTFKGKLKDNDTLTGYLSSDKGDMKWAADRVKDK